MENNFITAAEARRQTLENVAAENVDHVVERIQERITFAIKKKKTTIHMDGPSYDRLAGLTKQKIGEYFEKLGYLVKNSWVSW